MKDDSKRRSIFFFPDSLLNRELAWKPQADVYRIDGGWILKFDLAGVRLEDIKIWVERNVVFVAGVRRDVHIDQSWSCYSSEISYSHFERSIVLPHDLENSRIELEYCDGILLIRILSQ